MMNLINNIIKWFKYRLFKKYRYHIVAPDTLKPGYYDYDVRLLHCIMQILCEYIDKHEILMKGCIHGKTQEYHNNCKELYKIREWWLNDWPNRHKVDIYGVPIPEKPSGKLKFNYDDSDFKIEFTGDREAYNEWNARMYEIIEEWYTLSTDYCKRVIELREMLCL